MIVPKFSVSIFNTDFRKGIIESVIGKTLLISKC